MSGIGASLIAALTAIWHVVSCYQRVFTAAIPQPMPPRWNFTYPKKKRDKNALSSDHTTL
jgi:hypothetical protein